MRLYARVLPGTAGPHELGTVSIDTIVAFTEAVASLPLEPESRQASADISDTTGRTALHADLGHHSVDADVRDETGEALRED
ncbi:hypothetical protein [Brevibacterium linens]|uniref:hypothetical protein n=1 Tax=Brevibacterium linens TaxID=1703 RepID=UPI0013DFEA00